MRILKRLATGTLTSAVSITVTSAALAQSADILSAITAGRVAVISDGDYIARTYADSALPPEEAGHADMLTVLSIADGRVTKSAISVSNSVTAAPEILELTPDGRNAFVTERLGQRPDGARTARDLPAGNRVFAIDLSDAANPRLADTAEIGINPESLAVSPDGRTIAIVSNTSEASLLQIVEFSDGRFGDVAKFDLAALGIEGSAEGARSGVTATNVQWHPSGRYLAVNINTQDRIAFFEFRNAEAGPSVQPWGNTVSVGRDPFVGRFTQDGRHYLTSNWGRNFAATSLDGRIPKASSTMTVIRLAGPETANARHERLGTIETGVSAEGMAVSPDGRMVATINMQGTSFPEGSPRHQREASVSLLTFDPRTGTLTKVGDFAFEGVLPEGATFDLSGDHLLTTVFEGHPGAGPDAGAGIEVFRVVKGDMPALERIGRVALPHGVHHVDVAQ
ncbi:6-phosphogluconolactonase (cycloisomerase 2 family) [Rhizobium sp. BK316]|uniref:lactonase family protein n=1 Tax=Rhizobium sp. BK316 TaxID=2587053 RepID=UPI001618CD92|nr:beta-propeller fold lactonase family protein [Rhizobium sp. BK316]MBB3407352.1 6-phosphogluconolactonase (cycloisomerase 2 family) [Rhizobium sp. BK316]